MVFEHRQTHFMTTKRKLQVTGFGSLICLAGSGVSLVLTQIPVALTWGTQAQLLPFRPWVGRMASPWDVIAPLCGYAVSLFLFAAIILLAVFGWTILQSRQQRVMVRS